MVELDNAKDQLQKANTQLFGIISRILDPPKWAKDSHRTVRVMTKFDLDHMSLQAD